MTQNWYAVYTKPLCERKVSSALSRRGINNYYPLNKVIKIVPGSKKTVSEPLFGSIVFVRIDESEVWGLKQIPGVINLFYWRTNPAIIREEEIDLLQQFTSIYDNIKVEKSAVNVNGLIRVIDDPIISFKEYAATIRFQTLKILLPSLGFTMIAEREKVNEESLQMVSRSSLFTKLTNSSYLSN